MTTLTDHLGRERQFSIGQRIACRDGLFARTPGRIVSIDVLATYPITAEFGAGPLQWLLVREVIPLPESNDLADVQRWLDED